MRGMLAGRLLALNDRKTVRNWLADKKKELGKYPLSAYDQSLLGRLFP